MDLKTFPSAGFYYLPPPIPFLETLVDNFLTLTKDAPFSLGEYTILFPTQRSLRAFKNLLASSSKSSLFLPHLFALNDIAPSAEDFLRALSSDISFDNLQSLSLLPPLSSVRGRLLCTEALKRASGLFKSPLSAKTLETLSAALLEILGEAQSHGLSLENCDLYIPQTHGTHWEKTSLFLKTLMQLWPKILEAEHTSDPLAFIRKRLNILSEFLLKSPPSRPLIIAGVRGISPSLLPFLKTLSSCPHTIFLFDSFSKDFLSSSSQDLSPTHPYYELQNFLLSLQRSLADIKPWPFTSFPSDDSLEARLCLIHQALVLPAPQKKESDAAVFSRAIQHVSLFEASNPIEEARLIALRMRHILQTPQKTAALITPDRTLACLVKTELLQWGIQVDDSAGIPFSETLAGRYFLISLQALLEDNVPLLLISLLKHPLTRLKRNLQDLTCALETLELHALRGLKPLSAIDTFLMRLEEKIRSSSVPEEPLLEAVRLLEDFKKSFLDFKELLEKGAPTDVLLKAHEELLLQLSLCEDGSSLLWNTSTESEAFCVFQMLLQETKDLPPLKNTQYFSFLKNLLETNCLQRTLEEHPRLSILGLFESRLLKKDSVILGGLNEGTWPHLPEPNPWVHKHLREALSLPSLEARIGISVHDFLHGFLNKDVLLTRTKRTSAGLQKPSRILMHLQMVLDSKNLQLSPPPEADILKSLDKAPKPDFNFNPPNPSPPVLERPLAFSVSMIEMLQNDPYGFYARHILRLSVLKSFEEQPNLADFGTLLHSFIERFTSNSFVRSPEDILRELEKISVYKVLTPGEQYFWRVRFSSLWKQFMFHHEKRLNAPDLLECLSEVSLSHTFCVPSLPYSFDLKGRIDRLENTQTVFHIMDYKTGLLPSKDQIKHFLKPQLPLLGLLLKKDSKGQKAPSKEIALSYWSLKKDGASPLVTLKNTDVLLDSTEENLLKLFEKFYNSSAPAPYEAKAFLFSPYIHLARLKEWAGPLEALASEDIE